MNRAQAEAEQRAVPRRCRGPFAKDLSDAKRADFSESLTLALDVVTSEDLEPVDPATIKVRLLAIGCLAEAREFDRAMRPGCGADFNNVLCAHPFDGQVRTTSCPQCSQTIAFQSPRYVLDDASAE